MLRAQSSLVSGPSPLFFLTSANLQLTSDQAFTKIQPFASYRLTHVVARWKSGGTTVACTGGIYTAAAKGGSALVAATQSWLNLTAAGKIVSAVLAAVNDTDEQSATPILSLTTGSTAAATADLTLYGIILT